MRAEVVRSLIDKIAKVWIVIIKCRKINYVKEKSIINILCIKY